MLNKTDLFREKLQSQRLADYLRGYNVHTRAAIAL